MLEFIHILIFSCIAFIMSKHTGLTVVLVHVLLWTFYFTSLCLSCNSDCMLRFRKYQQKVNQNLEVYWSKSTYHHRSLDQNNTSNSDNVAVKLLNFTENVSQSKIKHFRRMQLGFPLVKLLKQENLKPDNSLHRLARRKRQDPGPVPGLMNDILGDFQKLPIGGGTSMSRAASGSGNAIAKAFAPGNGIGQAEAHTWNGGNSTAKAKALANNSTALATSEDGGHSLAASESGGTGNASSISVSQVKGSSKAVATVLEGQAVAIGIYEIVEPDMVFSNNNPPLPPAQKLSNGRIDFSDPFFGPGFKAKPKTMLLKTTSQQGRNFNTTSLEMPQSTTELYVPPSTTKLDQSRTTIEPEISTSTTEHDIVSSTIKSNTVPSQVISNKPARSEKPFGSHIQFHKGDHKESYPVFESNATSKCNNVPRKQLAAYNFVKTDTCMMVYNSFDCKSMTSRRLEPGHRSTIDFLIYSFHICNNDEGGLQLNLDLTAYYTGWMKKPKVVKSYNDVCQCINTEKHVQHMQYWSINNHGNELMAYYEDDCGEKLANSTLIFSGHSYESRNMHYLKKNGLKIQSIGPAKDSTYFRNSCLKMGSATRPTVEFRDQTEKKYEGSWLC